MSWQESARWKMKLGTVPGREQTEDFCLLFLAEQLAQGRGMSLGSRHHLHPSAAGPQERMAQAWVGAPHSWWKEDPCHEVSLPQALVFNAPRAPAELAMERSPPRWPFHPLSHGPTPIAHLGHAGSSGAVAMRRCSSWWCGPLRLPGPYVLGSVCFCLQLCLIGNSTL